MPVSVSLFRLLMDFQSQGDHSPVSTFHKITWRLPTQHTPCLPLQEIGLVLVLEEPATDASIPSLAFHACPCMRLQKKRCQVWLVQKQYYDSSACFHCGFRHKFHPFKAGGIYDDLKKIYDNLSLDPFFLGIHVSSCPVVGICYLLFYLFQLFFFVYDLCVSLLSGSLHYLIQMRTAERVIFQLLDLLV